MSDALSSSGMENSVAGLTFRELPPQEWEKLLQIPSMAAYGLPNRATTRAIVGEDAEGRIRAHWLYFIAVHVEPMGIDPEYRKHPGVVRQLWGKILDIMDSSEARLAFAIIEDKDLPQGNANYCSRLGFEKIEGSLYFVKRGEALDPRAKESA